MQKQQIIESLNSHNQNIRKQTLIYLIEHPNAEFVSVLSQLIKSDSKNLFLIIRALSKIEDESAVELLLKLFVHPNEEIRMFAASYLSPTLSQYALPKVIKIIENSDNEQERAVATWALAEMNLTNMLERLLDLTKDPNAEVRVLAVSGLHRFSDLQAKRVLIDCLQHDKDEWVRVEAAQGLAGYDGDDLIKIMVECLKTDESDDVRAKIVYALGDVGNSSIIDVLKNQLDSEADWIRSTIQSTIKRIIEKS